MAIGVKDILDIVKPFTDFIIKEISIYARNLAVYVTSFGRDVPYTNIKSAVIGNVLSSILLSICLGLSVIMYVVLFFPGKLQYNLDTRFFLGASSLVTVNMMFACVFYSVFSMQSHLDGSNKSERWRYSLTTNIPDFVIGLTLPAFVLGSIDLYFSIVNDWVNPLDVACALPSGYLSLGLIPILAVRLFVAIRLIRRPVESGGSPNGSWRTYFRSPMGAALLVTALAFALVQALVLRSMLFYSILAFDPC
jgi:hypothetical protein